MSTKIKTREITLVENSGTFGTFFKRWYGESEDYQFKDLAAVRNLISNEKARLLHTVKTKKPGSIYALARLLQRDGKSVNEDIKVLTRFGFIELVEEKVKGRKRLKPVIAVDSIKIEIKI